MESNWDKKTNEEKLDYFERAFNNIYRSGTHWREPLEVEANEEYFIGYIAERYKYRAENKTHKRHVNVVIDPKTYYRYSLGGGDIGTGFYRIKVKVKWQDVLIIDSSDSQIKIACNKFTVLGKNEFLRPIK
jgi:hypothetical protein